MSMPSFPEIDPNITCESALNMILASIAMEELALSHIINAEGEKLQYVLGTLESGSGEKSSTDEILAVNKSITNTLETVSQNQILLKNKMDSALNAISEICPKQCPPRCDAVFSSCFMHKWHVNQALPWEKEEIHGKCTHIDFTDNTKIKLSANGRFFVCFAVNVKSIQCFDRDITISLQKESGCQCLDLFTFHGYMLVLDNTITIAMNGIIVEVNEPSVLKLKLISPKTLIAENSMLSIMKI